MRGRILKQATVAVLLSTSVLSFSTIAYGNTSLNQSIDRTKTELSKGTMHYVYPAIEGKLISSEALYPALNSAKKKYERTRSLIHSSSVSTAQKLAMIEEIDNLYNEKITEGLVPYIDAYNYAVKYLAPIMSNIQDAQDRKDFAAVEKEYHKLSYQLKGRSAILYRFSGKAARDLLLDRYKKTADAKRDELMVPVTIYMETIKINDYVSNGRNEDAISSYAEIEALLSRLPNASTNKFVAALLEEVAKAKAAVDDLQSSPQDVLNKKVDSLTTFLNNTQSPYFTISTNATNSIVIHVKENASVVEFLDKGFYSAFTSQLGVTKVNGNAPTSPQAITYLASLFPGVTTTHEMKGKSLVIPLTVNNGSELEVNFTIHFQ
ncbi:hypothetical protein [Bacillus sp. FJAT-22090]|uniref:hypothetical protein n=1 Tax=Bacillus sp. FJAT-22090 TaxID=1581038 RepID=UPI0011A0658E|nr:hypothetical protein [Bacillus sp. FJAT-22090]